MAVIGKPPRKKGSKGTPPPIQETKANLQKPASNEKVQIHILASPEWKKELQLFAVEHDSNISEVLRTAFEEYKRGK